LKRNVCKCSDIPSGILTIDEIITEANENFREVKTMNNTSLFPENNRFAASINGLDIILFHHKDTKNAKKISS